MPASLTVFFGLLGRGWKLVASRRMQIIALLVILAMLVPQPANAQFGFLTGLIGIISSGLSAVSGVLAAVNTTLQNVIGPLLSEYQRSHVRDSEHHARDLGLPAEYRLPTSSDQFRPRPGRPDPRHLQLDPRYLEHCGPQRDARQSAGVWRT